MIQQNKEIGKKETWVLMEISKVEINKIAKNFNAGKRMTGCTKFHTHQDKKKFVLVTETTGYNLFPFQCLDFFTALYTMIVTTPATIMNNQHRINLSVAIRRVKAASCFFARFKFS
jgi:hypothetical protein